MTSMAMGTVQTMGSQEKLLGSIHTPLIGSADDDIRHPADAIDLVLKSVNSSHVLSPFCHCALRKHGRSWAVYCGIERDYRASF